MLKDQNFRLVEDNDQLQNKSKKWIARLDEEIEKNSKSMSDLVQKLKVVTEEKSKLQIKLSNSQFLERDLANAEE